MALQSARVLNGKLDTGVKENMQYYAVVTLDHDIINKNQSNKTDHVIPSEILFLTTNRVEAIEKLSELVDNKGAGITAVSHPGMTELIDMRAVSGWTGTYPAKSLLKTYMILSYPSKVKADRSAILSSPKGAADVVIQSQ